MKGAMKNVMCVSVHPDDETLGCGGTLLRHIAHGDMVYCIFVTAGNKEQEALIERVCSSYNFKNYWCLNLPELELQDLSLNEIIPKFSKIFSEISPNVLYIPNRSDVHSDHRKIYEAIISCTKSFRYPFIEEVYMCEVLSETDFAPALIENAFMANYFVNISEYFAQKLEILSVYEAELLPYPLTRNISAMTALNRYRGSQINEEYAEAFVMLKTIIK